MGCRFAVFLLDAAAKSPGFLRQSERRSLLISCKNSKNIGAVQVTNPLTPIRVQLEGEFSL
jgi:hypothetical protein